MLCLSGFELYFRWVPLNLQKILGDFCFSEQLFHRKQSAFGALEITL